jgi:hypothetical protein
LAADWHVQGLGKPKATGWWVETLGYGAGSNVWYPNLII